MTKKSNPKGKKKHQEKIVFFLDKPGRIDPRVIRKAVLEVKKMREKSRSRSSRSESCF